MSVAVLFSLVAALVAPLPGALGLRLIRGGEPQGGLRVTLESGAIRLESDTGIDGVARFLGVPPGPCKVSAGGRVWDLVVSSELTTLTLDLDAPRSHSGRFGSTELSREILSRLPNAGTVSTVLETLEPYAITDRIDVAGVESATDPLWSVRGSSWTQNRVLLDGLDITDPAGGSSLLYPDVSFFEDISLVTAANPPDAAGPGAELILRTRAAPSPFEGSFAVGYTGANLQSKNLDDELVSLGVEPREVRRFPSALLELGGRGVYGAIHGFSLGARLPHFDAEEKVGLLGAMGKLTRDRWSLPRPRAAGFPSHVRRRAARRAGDDRRRERDLSGRAARNRCRELRSSLRFLARRSGLEATRAMALPYAISRRAKRSRLRFS